MKDKTAIRYLGYRTLADGGRGFDFACTHGAAEPTTITIEASASLFEGPDRIALQEAAGICYETMKCRLQSDPTSVSRIVYLTPDDVAQHRRIAKGPRRT